MSTETEQLAKAMRALIKKKDEDAADLLLVQEATLASLYRKAVQRGLLSSRSAYQ